MRILFVGVFETQRRSTNTSQILALKKQGFQVVGYNYRTRALELGNKKRDDELINLVKERNFDLVIYSKCNVVSERVFVESSNHSKTCLWFMDPLVSYNQEMKTKTSLVDYFCCDKINVLMEAEKYNKNCFHICEGFDEDVDYPMVGIEKEYDISFIGNLYGDRETLLNKLDRNVTIINNAYGKHHSTCVAKTKINLNLTTSAGASDRVYKIMAAGGFLLTNDWHGREKYFKDGKEIVIFNGIDDLNDKIGFYLRNEKKRNEIAKAGLEKVQQFNRTSWAKKIVGLYEKVK